MDNLSVEPALEADRAVFSRYFQFYLYDFSQYGGGQPVDGMFPYPWLDLYWQRGEQCWPFWAKIDGEIAGLALVSFEESEGATEMNEFFVVNRFRRRGIGKAFARTLIPRFKGVWRIVQILPNLPAIAFWPHV
ncbi:MAG: GNAT family N-acetyltransferase, partial [Hyphomicrobiaceae bacterium]